MIVNEKKTENKNNDDGEKENLIILITKKNCPDCIRFSKEWNIFKKIYYLKFVKILYNCGLNPSDQIPKLQQILYDDQEPIEISKIKREYILKNYARGKDGYPLLLFYINGRRWKPYWFKINSFRTAKNIFITSILLYKISNCFITIPTNLKAGLRKMFWTNDKFIPLSEFSTIIAGMDKMDKMNIFILYDYAHWQLLQKNIQKYINKQNNIQNILNDLKHMESDSFTMIKNKIIENYPTVKNILSFHLTTN